MSEHDIDFEGGEVLCLVVSMLGAITPSFRAVSLRCTPEAVSVFFVLSSEDIESREEIEEIMCDFESFHDGRLDINSVVLVDSSTPITELDVGRRLVYHRKE